MRVEKERNVFRRFYQEKSLLNIFVHDECKEMLVLAFGVKEKVKIFTAYL